MALAKEDLALIDRHVREHLGEWLAEQGLVGPPDAFERELRERIVRVEEELKHQRDLMRQGFERMDERFEQVDKRFEQIERRFEQVDKRFERVDKRFERVDQRFESLEHRMDRFMRWSFGITLTAAGLVVAAIKLLP